MILKKLFAVLVMCVALLAATPVWAYDVYYQGEKLAKSELHFGQDCVPARAVFEKLGFDVQWGLNITICFCGILSVGRYICGWVNGKPCF